MNSEGFKAWLETTDRKHSLGDYFTVLQGTATAFAQLEADSVALQQKYDNALEFSTNMTIRASELTEDKEVLQRQVKELKIDLDKPPQERSYCVGCSLLSIEPE